MSNQNFYVTTPIYYVNDKPHIGHAYTTILADVLVRYHRMLGHDAYLLTGTDEHGQKVQRAAEANAVSPIEHCDATVVRYKELWGRLDIRYDDFIRTTEERHKRVVRACLQRLWDKGLIYRSEYKGMYCVPCERYFMDKDLGVGGLCPDCGRKTDELLESNYFFKMSLYQDWLVEHIKTHPEFIQPAFRANETLGFLKKPLGDLCISRPKSRLSWGIELPFDSEYVCYVWFDALLNYVSAVGYLSDDALFKRHWPASFHLIGKDILTTHTVYWPIMLKALDIEPPLSVFAHGWWLSGEAKMSKSTGNVASPIDLIDIYGVDAVRYFLMAEMTLGQDASFTRDGLSSHYHFKLANDLGNLVNRVVCLGLKHFDGAVPPAGAATEPEVELKGVCMEAVKSMRSAVESMRLNQGIDSVLCAVRAGNKYIEQTAPWKLAKSQNMDRLATVLRTGAECLRVVSILLNPVMPSKMSDLRAILGIDPAAPVDFASAGIWGLYSDSAVMPKGSKILFPLVAEPVEPEATKPPSKDKAVVVKTPEPAAPEGVILSIEEFQRVKLKTAKVLAAEKVAGADKLLRLDVELGAESRQIVAGIALHYKPEELVGRTIIVVANLKPAKIRGLESNGMLLAAKSGSALRLLMVDSGCDIPSGSSVG